MLKCNMDRKEGLVSVEFQGTLADLGPEMMAILHEVYNGIRKQDTEAAGEFKRAMIASVLDPKSPIWAKE